MLVAETEKGCEQLIVVNLGLQTVLCEQSIWWLRIESQRVNTRPKTDRRHRQAQRCELLQD